MRSSLLRILMAMVVGLGSPLCCCQAAMVAGALAGTPGECTIGGEPRAVSPAASACCDYCRDEPVSSETPEHSDSSDHDRTPCDRTPCDRTPCHDCPACQGMLGLARLDGEGAALKSLTSVMAARFIALPTELAPALPCTGQRLPPRPPDYLARDAGGRSLLRFHCALIV